jgi:aspartyl protease family protein
MALSSGTRSLLGEATSWLTAAAVVAAGLIFYDDIRSKLADGLGVAVTDPAPVSAAVVELPVQQKTSAASVELRARGDGHYYARAEVNGRPADVMVDTGATMVALTYEDAERAGVHLKPSDFTQSVSTANGTARFALVRLDRVSIGNITVRDVKAGVAERGRLSITLLGMSFLSRLERVDMRSGTLVLTE